MKTYEELEQELTKDVEFLTNNPDEIYKWWNTIKGRLFRKLCFSNSLNDNAGCPTQIKAFSNKGWYHAYDRNDDIMESLERKIYSIENFPSHGRDIKPEHLPLFKEIQLEHFKAK